MKFATIMLMVCNARGVARWGLVGGMSAVAVLGALAQPASADRYSSTNYVIDASTLNTFGGDSASGSYSLTSSGGDTIIGNGSGGSYKLGQGYIAQLEHSLQLHVQPSNLVAYYPLDEGAGGAVYDSSANAHHGVTVNNPSWVSGEVGTGIGLTPASSQSISIPDSNDFSGVSQFTITMWAKQDARSGNRALITHWDYTGGAPQSGSWALQTVSGSGSDDALRFMVASGDTDPGNNYVTTTESWQAALGYNYVAVVYDGTQQNSERVKIYIDGYDRTDETVGTIPTSLNNASAPLLIGEFLGLGRYWNGGIDHVKLFSRALTADEINIELEAQAAYDAATGITLGDITPGVSSMVTFDAITTASTTSYGLAVNQDGDLNSGIDTIPAIPGSVASPIAWSEGTTKGLGFTLVSGVGISNIWDSGNKYAALPSTATTFYTRTGYTAGAKDVLGMRLRIDVELDQLAGDYINTMIITGTTIP